MNIELHIERLILDGLQVEPRSRWALQAAVEAELTRLLAADGLRPDLLSGVAVRSLGGSEIRSPSQTSPDQLGKHIALAVQGAIGPQAGSPSGRNS